VEAIKAECQYLSNKGIDANKEGLHNLVSLLLTNKALRSEVTAR
jgi:hypothetical protein